MDVLLPEGIELNRFERALQETLQKADLPGYALIGFTYIEASTPQRHTIDALLILEPGVFVCVEAKGYNGTWTGNANERWFSNNQEIRTGGGNPYQQVLRYTFAIKNKLTEGLFKEINQDSVWVDSLIVAPDNAEFQINGAVIDRFRRNTILICHLSQIRNVVRSINPPRQPIRQKVEELNNLLEIASNLTGISVERLKKLIVNQEEPLPDPNQDGNPPETDVDRPDDTQSEPPTEPTKNSSSTGKNPDGGNGKNNLFTVIISIVSVVGIFGTLGLTYFWNNRPCENPEEIRVSGICYKDIAQTPLTIGILTSPEDYSLLQDYLRKELGSEVADVAIAGGVDSTYQDAQNNIALKTWDVVFALSPMNGMRAKDNGYRWVARMFPNYPATYQSALFVRQDSPIQSINDITSDTKIALGDFSSASSFYIPSYNLYGKSITVMSGNRSSEIIELVASGKADIGAAVYGQVQGDRRFRIIQVSREIPGTGVYLSPNLPPTVSDKIAKILMDAPAEIKKEANYGADEEPDYEVLRLISLRVDEILSCADFSQNPVQFFCLETPEGIVGTIRGFTNEDNESVRLRLERENGEICDVVTSLKTLSSVPDGTSPGILNRKRVSVIGVEPQRDGESCEMIILNPSQLKVLSAGE